MKKCILWSFLVISMGVCGCYSTMDAQKMEDHLKQQLEAQLVDRVNEVVSEKLSKIEENCVKREKAAALDDAEKLGSSNAAERAWVKEDSQEASRQGREARYRTEDERNTMDIFQEAAPGTVYVTQNQIIRDWRTARAMEVPVGEGTGFVWDQSGHIVTNYHVIDGASTLSVKLYNQKTYTARLVGGEPKKDIAVLKIDASADELVPLHVPDAEYELAVGQKTIAIGNPFGLDHSLTTGIVSAIGRDKTGYGGVTIRDMIQTDASINPGNSGGPLLDSSGLLIGMNTMIATKTGESAGIGFAVPYTTIHQVVSEIIKFGHVQQTGLGISILDDRVAQRYGVRGVIIRAVSAGSPADKAGLRGLTTGPRGTFIGDIVVGIDGQAVTKYDDLYGILDRHKAGDTVLVKIRRGESEIEIPVEVYVLP